MPCAIGYTKDNSIQRASDQCQRCPESLITPSVGSISQDNCTVGKYDRSVRYDFEKLEIW